MTKHTPFIWHELVTIKPVQCAEFYRQIMGWSVKEVDAGEFGTYTLFQKEGQDIAGMMAPTPDTPGDGPYWHSYLEVENVDAIAQQTMSLGGTVVVPAHDVPEVGRICVVSDPSGANIHLMQPRFEAD